MKIENISLVRIRGEKSTRDPYWEERLLTPLDIYEEYREKLDTAAEFVQSKNNILSLNQIFLKIDTEDGIQGLSGPMNETVAHIILKHLKHMLIGKDAFAIEKIWDQMFRSLVHGRHGEHMWAVSFVDCALWDIKGKALQQPVYSLLGGAMVDSIPCYASMLGFDVKDMELVKERAMEYKEKGFKAQKWFFRYGPASGNEGMKQNIKLVETLRSNLGDDYDLMFDCWQSMNVTYVIKLAKYIEEFSPKWIEECVMPDRIDSYVRLKNKISIPLAGAEHEYTRWGIKRFIDRDALDIIQADPLWCGGISEMIKISALTTSSDLILIPHAGAMPAGVHFSFSQSPIHTPYIEYLVKWMPILQYFYENPVIPDKGIIVPSKEYGLGVSLLNEKIVHQEEVRYE